MHSQEEFWNYVEVENQKVAAITGTVCPTCGTQNRDVSVGGHAAVECPNCDLKIHPDILNWAGQMGWDVTEDNRIVNNNPETRNTKSGDVILDPSCDICRRRASSGDLSGRWHFEHAPGKAETFD